ncbi:class I SAM-dependent methyltransferase [Patescibacteria group bacterium]|nr:class I SAM-dependent methyltransferase [Patescibacteria group bacterium]MBU1952084.1 class I SAM-dependent methyltransferase [Patescibacteria group bacterium]
MLKNVNYYFWATYRRKSIDRILKENIHFYNGFVLDIGGRKRGQFKEPMGKVKKWIYTDINKKHKPDLVLDVSHMDTIKSESVDVINAIELFEHVKRIEDGLKECYRVLKNGGTIIICVPFLYPVHADPNDFQRWTEDKWKNELVKVGFQISKIVIMGRYFTVLMDMKKELIKLLPFPIKHFFYLFYPLMDLAVKLDNSKWVKKNKRLMKYHSGYYIVANK